MFDPPTQNVNDAALANLALQSSEELLADRAVVVEVKRLNKMMLRCQEKGSELGNIDGPRAVVVGGIPKQPVVQADERFRFVAEAGPRRRGNRLGHLLDDKALQPLFAR